ncbi:hypothetical protein [Antarcticirhabdus aurantiaca]|uniref:Uncharacterized protein n=1 Tax=Antarcticirhabdus aurantiaca TaxID=2606717 RepID=A0ACD4NSD5_9HYPH|nr:hypothetical protein [Antarcticirhabdus aurantiaca]WAJ29653.1 hypothetical protein OXU80_05330 [Jeongeuplla avenae]
MLADAQAIDGAETGSAEPMAAVEFELALDTQDPTRASFEDCVRAAAAVVGGEILFAIPTDGSIEDASQIAAVRLEAGEPGGILFALLDESETAIRVPDRTEVGERFYGFANAFVGVLTRIRDDLSFAQVPAEGTA